MVRVSPLEINARLKIDTRLRNLGWNLDHSDPGCNVFQEQPKTKEQKKLLKGKKPDYILYQTGTNKPIAVIEAKKAGENLDNAMEHAINKYAKPLQVPLAFAFNDNFVISRNIFHNRPLKIDGEELQDFIDHYTALRFLNEGSEILSAPKGINFDRGRLLKIFKKVNGVLRKEGLRDGYERFSAFSEIMFLKLMDESEQLACHKGYSKRFDDRFLWSSFTQKYKNDDRALLDFVANSVWKNLQKEYGNIFTNSFHIRKPSSFKEIIELINPINLSATDTDVKGDAFEYFLKTVTNGNKDLGEYFTPRHIIRTMVNLINPLHGETIYDPFCGTGGFLLEAFKHLSLRSDMSNPDMLNWVKEKALFGREITSTARIAKMNMILFGDGHTNIEQLDSLEKPIKGKHAICLSNIPYSQKTEYGALYSIPSTNADAICMQHIWESLRPNGRAAVIIPESFLYENGAIGKTREIILKGSEKVDVISLPRGVFMPYTPTKTNILYFKKGDEKFKTIFFFSIQNDGFELNTKRKPIAGSSDIQLLLNNIDNKKPIKSVSNVVSRQIIKKSMNWNLRQFYYMEDIPYIKGNMIRLGDGVVVERKIKIDPRGFPDNDFKIIEVSQNGIFLGDTIKGAVATQKYKIVESGDIVYNPYRVNIGSIGVVPPNLDRALASPAYVVFKSKNELYSPLYIVFILKQPRYLKVIMKYSLSSARASLPFSELERIKIPALSDKESEKMKDFDKKMQDCAIKREAVEANVANFVATQIEEQKPDKAVFDALIDNSLQFDE